MNNSSGDKIMLNTSGTGEMPAYKTPLNFEPSGETQGDWIEEYRELSDELYRGIALKQTDWNYVEKRNERFIQSAISQALQQERERLATWIDGNVGVSSKAIYLYMTTGEKPRSFDAPSDAGDRARCVVLLKAIPEWQDRLKEIEDMHLQAGFMFSGEVVEPWNEQIPLILNELRSKE